MIKSSSSVVLGRHTLLPTECRLRHGSISRQHVKIDCVGLPATKPNAAKGRKSKKARTDDGSCDEPEPSPYVLTVLGRNNVFVNGKLLMRGERYRLCVNDTLSFLEDAFDPSAGIFQPRPQASTDSLPKPTTRLAELLAERSLLPIRRSVAEGGGALAADESGGDFSPLQRSASKTGSRNPLPVFMLRCRGGSPPVGTKAAPKRLQVESPPGSDSDESNEESPRKQLQPAGSAAGTKRRRGRN
jgi:hypothetical protein